MATEQLASFHETLKSMWRHELEDVTYERPHETEENDWPSYATFSDKNGVEFIMSIQSIKNGVVTGKYQSWEYNAYDFADEDEVISVNVEDFNISGLAVLVDLVREKK